jgi:RimJ/RimL family protein N-acetyltransferase
MKLKSTNLSYVLLAEEHFDHYKMLEMDPDVMKYYKRLAKTDEEARVFYMKYINYRARFPEMGAWAVFSHNTEFIGLAIIVHLEAKPENEKVEFGYRLAKEFWGKGHGTEIAKALVHYAFEDLNLSEIYGTTDPDNIVSQKVLQKAGLAFVGLAPYYNGCKLFKLARDQWKSALQA